MVHRAGLRLPDHRVELYEHVTRILVGNDWWCQWWEPIEDDDAA